MRDKYTKILVPLDGSEQSKEALKEAVAVAKRNMTSLVLLHVKDEARISGTPYALALKLEDLENEAKEIVAEAQELVGDEVAVDIHRTTGSPKKEIVNLANELGIELIVMGSSGKGLLDRMLVGSTTTYVISHAPCNVMVVR